MELSGIMEESVDLRKAESPPRCMINFQSQIASICAQLGNTQTVHHFFNPYDCYEGRTFGLWELDIIFEGKISEHDFRVLCE